MRFSRIGIFVLVLSTVLIGANCSYYDRIITRKNLVDGGKAYKDRKFQEAGQFFRDAIARDPEGRTSESKTAQLFLARTLHSEYIGNRQNTAKADEAIQEYKKVLAENPSDQSSFNAVANLLENLNRNDEWLKWVTDRTNDEKVPPDQRAEALTKLAAKKYSCANDISDAEPVKKTVTKDGKPSFVFSKPQNSEDYEKLKQCTAEGTELINRAEKLDTNSEAVWSYKANMLIQQMRLAEMEGKTAEQERIKVEADRAKDRFTELATAKKAKEDEEKRIQEEKDAAANKK
jgi:tetratricopeptide (TPR) repeat protein